MPSDVQVFVRFREKSVFAGEELSAIITFRNIADVQEHDPIAPTRRSNPRQGNSASNTSRNALHGRAQTRATQVRSRHQSSVSVSSTPLPQDLEQSASSSRPNLKHKRSMTIVSVGPNIRASSPDKSPGSVSRGNPSGLGHRRSSTVQHVGQGQRRPSPGTQNSTDIRSAVRNGQRSPLSASETPPSGTVETAPEFKFPPAHLLNANTPESAQGTPVLGPRQRQTPRGLGLPPGYRDHGDLYAQSNNSQETIMSEQQSIMSERPHLPAPLSRPLQRGNNMHNQRLEAANLLMGYAQVNATFTLDASLVDQAPFEEVKKKGFLGGQAGGGVVGVKKKARPASGLLSSFGFSSLGESLESIMGGDNLSSVKEMNAVTNSRAIPLLSTPQSLLFVDLRLEPGEEKSFSFTFTLPRGLPSTYRGKAIKISYNLTIGVQGAPGSKEMQAVRQVNVPIRVFSGVDSEGEIFGHDLMQPYVILKDTASTKMIDIRNEDNGGQSKSEDAEKITADEFLQYVDKLLDKNRRRQSSSGTIDAMFGTFAPEKSAALRAINRAIMLSNQITAASESSPNRFEIARSGLKIATVIVDRPLHRLGEVVTTVIDFSESQMICTSLRATLESAERVANSLAVRSASAISRITKKVYASRSETVLFIDRAVFNPTIPANATPTFVTSGVNLEWYIKLEFGTVRGSSDEGDEHRIPSLLEEVIQDERGSVNVAVENLDCDTFEVLIPITVYGDLITDGRESEDVVGIAI